MRVLELIDVHRAREAIIATCAIDDLRFHATVWYEDLDLHELAREHGDELVERLCVHVALFQLNTAASLRPDAIVLGRYASHLTAELQALWSIIFRHVWAQWRWEHALPDYHGPKFVEPIQPSVRAARVTPGPTELLAFCGGGKDSLVSLRLLERAGLPFATLGYSHSIYGPAEPQHALLERVAGGVGRTRAERQWIFDDLLDSPVAKLRPSLGVQSLLAAETPASVFAALPLALARGYRGLVVGHEHSANTGNLVWDATGEEVNHQWGKGWEAEQLLDRYVRSRFARRRPLLQRAAADQRRSDLRAVVARRRARRRARTRATSPSRGAARARSARTCGCSSRRTCRPTSCTRRSASR